MYYRHRDDCFFFFFFITDGVALVRSLAPHWLKAFGDLLTLLQKSSFIYHEHGNCDYVFGTYTGAPSIRDQEHERSTAPRLCTLTKITLESPVPAMANFWPSQEVILQQLVYNHVCALAKHLPHPTVASQLSLQGD